MLRRWTLIPCCEVAWMEPCPTDRCIRADRARAESGAVAMKAPSGHQPRIPLRYIRATMELRCSHVDRGES
jgi:hypothetical protein